MRTKIPNVALMAPRRASERCVCGNPIPEVKTRSVATCVCGCRWLVGPVAAKVELPPQWGWNGKIGGDSRTVYLLPR